ncbi:hypothetical protein BGX29_004799 [Mortierella sp. GBA35]|nr:hypothetical protein BGX29_004799 [Mortierella sp. GBA35]
MNNSFRGGHGRGPRGGGGPGGMNFPNEQQQPQGQFNFQQRGFPPHMMQQQQGPQQQQPPHGPQQIQIPSNQQAQRFMTGMPSPSIVQSSSMGYPGGGGGVQGSNPNAVRTPFGPPVGPMDQRPKTHHDIFRKHQEEYELKQSAQMAQAQAQATTPGTYIWMASKNNNMVIPVLPRLPNPYPPRD